MAEEDAESRTLETTPTWAVAIVCFVLIATSLLIEHGLNLLGKYFNKRRRKALIQALEKIKSDLLLLGFISLLLTISEKSIANICIPKSVGETFLPCQSMTSDADEESKCEEQDKLSLLSRSGVQQLQLLIFAVAFFHVCSSFLTFSLGMAKLSRRVDMGKIRVGLIVGIGLCAASKSLYNFEGGHRAVVFNRVVGVKDKNMPFTLLK